ncbi:VOC family protein [Streptomyces sp. NBC_00236]|uniref:VOC family protein n=1 Tax=unclassified Streptomyces TaxID=2593676 RepID=UPI002E29B7F6|nr:VOC family protein [Streptomyces sp. NBC_00236]
METTASFPHHLGVFASGFEAGERFCTSAPGAPGVGVGFRADGGAEYWSPERDTPSLSLERAEDAVTEGVHIAFTAVSRDAADAFRSAAAAAGGASRHGPRTWGGYRAHCAFVSDPDGNNIEAVQKETSRRSGAGVQDHVDRSAVGTR